MISRALDDARLAAYRRFCADSLHRYLRAVWPKNTVAYDGDRIVTTGPISIHYDTPEVEIHFPNQFTDDNTDVVVRVPGQLTFPAVVTVVEGLLSGWTVTA
ncbi:hypothetical protein [Paractinoplanes globisporus]|uniref:Uncharacterized protein n=1 Tax=Paractinoplanes globisporus TaxID=113565 RepID=A0ABW6WHV9_9ACTN|nr:hypothetical protein [Actinoplanes globisporus]